jgi:hypothetical protein
MNGPISGMVVPAIRGAVAVLVERVGVRVGRDLPRLPPDHATHHVPHGGIVKMRQIRKHCMVLSRSHIAGMSPVIMNVVPSFQKRRWSPTSSETCVVYVSPALVAQEDTGSFDMLLQGFRYRHCCFVLRCPYFTVIMNRGCAAVKAGIDREGQFL